MAEGGDEDDDSKTEEPSQKKIDEAIKRGDVAKSQELSTFFVLSGATIFVAFLTPGLTRDLARPLAALIEHADEIVLDQRGLTDVYLHIGLIVAGVLALPALLFLVAGVGGSAIQHRLLWTMEPIIPKFSKVSPLAGLKRIFSAEGGMQGVKGVIKIVVVGVAMVMALRPEMRRLDTMVQVETVGLLAVIQSAAVKMMFAVLIVMAFVAGLDYIFQRRRWMKRQRMSREELKEEFKQTEGNPEIKAKIRQMRQARARRRMMAAVPKATVVVTNPTHFAVALRYEPGMRAPTVVAKGVDDLALKIREVAAQHDVPVVENPPLARALHATVDIDKEIPEEHYKAVAEVVGFVMRLDRRRGARPL
ncbi:flagellar biosynthesis protein FlhB [Siculibacillus lacustris]|uniref:Flagellar biosynthetic protein FlhB n=1 Tax=Siculibacillus lacustris TaxID=1549641 RepID=A0A4Q9VT91_9HYPH|nr:flagellar biosynthesis protein FlhB [Siculibacillus lacustris]TBW38186.1 flagellar biosynthesis protein FlhB [Siculibacillus lacustris]